MRVKILSCLAALALAPAIGSSGAAASPLAQGATAKAAAPAGIQLAQADKLPAVRDLNTGGGGSGGRSGGGDGVYTGGRGGDGVYRGGGGGRTFNTPGGQVRDLNRTPGAGLGDSRGSFRSRDVRRSDNVRRFDNDRSFNDRRFVDRRHGSRHDRWRHRHTFRGGIYVDPYASYAYDNACHRHYRGVRVLRHCHPYDYARHRHGGWR
jgi:hypothetical protein